LGLLPTDSHWSPTHRNCSSAPHVPTFVTQALLREQRAVAGPVRGVGVPAAPDVVGHGGVGAHDAGGGGLGKGAGAAVFLEEREKR